MNRKIILLPLCVAMLGLASCGGTPTSSSSASVTPVSSSESGTSGTVAPTVTSVTVSAADGATSVGVNKTLQLTATVEGTGDFSKNVSWKSSDEAAATISTTGVVTGVAAKDEVTFTATSKTDSTKTGTIKLAVVAAVDTVSSIAAVGVDYTIKVKVVAKDLQDVAFADQTGFLYGYFGSGKDTDTYHIADFAIGDYYEIKGQVGYYYGVWQIYPNGGTDSNKAVIPALTSATKLTETAPEISDTAIDLTSAVIAAHAASPSDWGNSAIKYVKYSSILTVVAGASYNTYKTVVGDYDVRLHSLDTTQFPGLLNGVKYDIIGLDFGWNGGNKYQNILVTKITKVDVTITGLTISGDKEVYVGKSTTLSAVGTPDGADGSCTWSSINPELATVDAATGVVTGVAAGDATIRATSTVVSTITADYVVKVIAGLPVLPVNVTFANALPTGWTAAEEGYAAYTPGFYSGGQFKINYEKIYLISPAFAASAATGVKVSLVIDKLNQGNKDPTAAATDPIFTITGLKADGTTEVGHGTILVSQITAAGTFDVTIAGADIQIVKIYTNNLPTSNAKKANMSLASIAITAAA
jgi:trimeric autotransporter adhesin